MKKTCILLLVLAFFARGAYAQKGSSLLENKVQYFGKTKLGLADSSKLTTNKLKTANLMFLQRKNESLLRFKDLINNNVLVVYSKMPVVKLGGNYNMPVAKITDVENPVMLTKKVEINPTQLP
jgi:hypothetical protein